ncbi:hypothetical protein ACLB2K_054911 [Fragaria x ananassa]
MQDYRKETCYKSRVSGKLTVYVRQHKHEILSYLKREKLKVPQKKGRQEEEEEDDTEEEEVEQYLVEMRALEVEEIEKDEKEDEDEDLEKILHTQ